MTATRSTNEATGASNASTDAATKVAWTTAGAASVTPSAGVMCVQGHSSRGASSGGQQGAWDTGAGAPVHGRHVQS